MEIDPVWLEVDFCETLGVGPDAERSEITRAYRRLARCPRPRRTCPEGPRRLARHRRVHVPGHLTDRQPTLVDELADFEDPQELRAHLELNP